MKTLIAYRARFWARFPRLSHWMGAPRTRAALLVWALASACGDIADGAISRSLMYLPAILLGLTAAWWLYSEGVHSATCPCASDPEAWAFEPEDEVPGDD